MHTHTFLRSLTAGFLVTGIAFLTSVSTQHTLASVSGMGSSVGISATRLEVKPDTQARLLPVHSSPFEQEAHGDMEVQQLIIGMLLVLAGFMTHAMVVLRKEAVQNAGRVLRGHVDRELDRQLRPRVY